MADKYWWEDEEKDKSGEQKGYWFDDGSTAKTVGTNITNRVNTWLKNHNTYLSNYQNRYSGRKYTYEDAYVNDSSSWLATVSKQKNNFDAEADSILAYMDRFEGYLDADWTKSVRDTLTNARSQQSIVLDNAEKDNEWWSNFTDEAEYQTAARYDGYRKKYNGKKYDDIQKALSTLSDGEEKDWLSYYQYDLYNEDRAYTSKSASGLKSFEAQKVAEAEKEANKTWWDRVLENFATSSSDTSLPTALVSNTVHEYRNDTSYREPNEDWSDGQRRQFGYLYAESPDKAYEYAVQINNQIAAMKKYEQQQAIGSAASSSFGSGVLHTLGSLATAHFALADLLDDLAQGAARGVVMQHDSVSPFEYSQAVQSGIANKLNDTVLPEWIPVFGGKGWGDVYSLGASAASSMLSALAFGGAGTLVNFIGQGGAAGVDDALSRGASAEQAILYGTIVGAAEGATEAIGADHLLKIGSASTVKNYLLNALNQGIGEFFEEGASSIIGNVADAFIMKDKSNLNIAVEEYTQEYIKSGLSEEEAKKKAKEKAVEEMFEEIAYDAVGGFVTGSVNAGITGGVSTVLDAGKGNQANINAVNQYGESTNELIQEGLQSDPKSESYKLAQKYQQQVQGKDGKNGKELSGFQIRNLVNANEAQFTVENYNDALGKAKDRLNALGETKNIDKVADLVAKKVSGQELTRSEKSTLARSQFGAQVAKELTTANQTSESSKQNYVSYKPITDRVGEESRYGVSESGQTTIRNENEAVSIAEVSGIEDGQMTVKTEDGREVYAGDIDFANDSEAYLYSAVADMENITPSAATALIKAYDSNSNMTVQEYVDGIDEAYTYGYYGYSESDLKSGDYAANLSGEQMMSAYRLGQSARNIGVESNEAKFVKMRTAAEATVSKKATASQQKALFKSDNAEVYFEDGGTVVKFDEHGGQYDEKRMAGVNAAKFLSKMGLGGKYFFYESYENAEGKRVYKDSDGNEVAAPNGIYKKSDGSIHIDLNAGNDGQGTTLFTLGHELTHFVKSNSEKQFKVLSDLVTEAFGKTDLSMHERVVQMQDRLSENRGTHVSYDEAFEEVVADAMSSMFSEGNIYEKLAELKAKDKGLFNTIRKFIEKLISKFKDLYAELTPEQKDARDIREMKSLFDSIQDAFAKALVEASENYQSSLTLGEESVVVNDNGDPVAYSTEDGSVLLSIRTYEEEGRNTFRDYLQKCVASEKLTKAEMQEMLYGIEEIYGVCKEFKDKYAPFSSWSDAAVVRDTYGKPVFSIVTPNGDYKMNLDFSLVCKKRRTLDAVFNEMSKRGIIDDFELGQKSVVKINEIIRKHGLETACALCFVDAKRFRQASMADSFTSLYNELVESLVPEDQRGSIDHFNFVGDETVKNVENGIHTWDASKLDFSHLDDVMKKYGNGTVEYKAAKYIKSNAEGRKLLLRGDFMSSSGFDAVKTKNRDILKLYNSKKGTGGPKAAFGDVQYMNDIIGKARTWTPAKAYSVGGVRIQSFSDYVPRMVFDYVQMIYDLAATKLPAHAYTKEALFVKQFGLTGVKINMSLIPAIAEGGIAPGLDANGNYVWAGESFDFETAKQIQNADGYTENCGTICVGVSHDHIVKLLRDPDIRMVIPYHKSGLNPIVAHMNKIAEFTDYTDVQRTKGKDGKALKQDFDFSKAIHDMGENESPKAVADQYLKWCVSNGYTARFSEFAGEENYYKLLEDFNLYDKDGNYVPQREVRAVFPNSDSAFGSMKELIQEGLEEDAVIEGKRDSSLSSIVDEIQRTLPKTEAEIEEVQVKQADRDLESEVKFSENEDIRYSERTDDSKSNRTLLANAFEGITKSSKEYETIQEYKNSIKLLNEQEAKLRDLNREIRKILFGTDGARDTERLKQLQEEAKKVANKINRHDKKLISLEASEPLRKVIERERKKEAQNVKAHVEEIQQNKKIRSEQTELRHKIRKTVRDLDKILNRGTKKKNVKEDIQPVVTAALKASDILFTDNYGTLDMIRNGIGADMSDSEEALVASCAKMLKDIDNMPYDGEENRKARQEAERKLKNKMSSLSDVFARERKRMNNTTVSSVLTDLADSYAKLENSEQSYVQGAYSEAVHDFIKSLQTDVGGTIVKDMTKSQLESVYKAYKMVLTTVRDANKMFNAGLKMSREQLGNAVIEEVIKAGGVHGLRTKADISRSKANWNNMKPIWVANRIGSDTFGKLMQGLFNGQYNFAVDVEDARNFKIRMDEKYHPRSWDTDKQYEFESSTGTKFSLNLQQIMSLYAFSKRGDQAYSHLMNGGFVFDDNSTMIVDKNGRKKTYIHDGATSYKLNEANLNAIIKTLTSEQKAYVDEMQAYLSDVMGEKGNEVTMRLYGVRLFNEKNYFPLRSSGAYMEIAKEAELKKQQGQIKLVNSGFTHAVKPNAKNPIILSGFLDVWSEHCGEMSMYHSMVLPMEDFRKVYNYSTVHNSKMESSSVYQTMQDAYGKAATDYIDQLYRELNAGATIDPRETTVKARISKFKKAAVLLSGSVVVQQFSSIGRAFAIIDPKFFIGTKVNSGTNLSVVDEMKKYAPVAIIKEMGGFDTGTKGSAKSYIMEEQYWKGERIKGFLKDDQYRSNLMGMMPAKADEITWCAIWEAVKRETKAKNPKMDVKSEEFLKTAGDRFSEIIEKTQVYDSVLARSSNMRSKSAIMQMATAFMAEPTTTVNLLEDAILGGKAKQIARAFGSVAFSIILNNALASVVYAMRDDDEDETFLEKYFQSFASGIVDDLNPMTYYPFFKDVYSLFQGYDVERADMSVITDLRDAMKKAFVVFGKDTSEMDDDELADHWKNVSGIMMNILDAGCSMFGVPVKNIRRDVYGMVNAWNTIGKDVSGRETTWNSFWDKVGSAIKDTIPIYAWTKDESKADKLYDAIVSGDTAYVGRIKSTYKTEASYNSAVRKALRENDYRIHEAAQAKYDGNSTEYKRIFREIQNEGNFGFDDIMSAVNAELSGIKSEQKGDTVTSEYSASDFVNAVIVGESGVAKTIMDDIIASKVANGKTKEEAEASFASSVSTGTRNAFDSGMLDEAGAEKMLTDYAGIDEEKAASKVDYWSFIKKNPQYRDDLSQSNVEDFREFAEPADISLDVFVQFLNGTKGLSTKYDEWGDVEVSKREQVLKVIDSLPLTWQQKDALYLAAGYTESNIWDVPW